jgi:hypothetical protein
MILKHPTELAMAEVSPTTAHGCPTEISTAIPMILNPSTDLAMAERSPTTVNESPTEISTAKISTEISTATATILKHSI